MEIISILLICDDLDYAYTFAKCVAAKNNRLLFTVITRVQFEKESNLEKYDLLLLDGESQASQKPFIWLVEKRIPLSTSEGQQHYLYKYENASYFEAQILFYYGLITGRKAMHVAKEGTKILTFHGSRGGTGKTSIALGLAQELRRFHDKSVIYINYEEIETTDSYFSCSEGDKTISDYLYYLNSNESVCSYVSSFTVKDEYGVEAFAPSEGRNELKLLKIEELSIFLKVLLDGGGYDFIIFDCDISLNKECMWILSISDLIFNVEKYQNAMQQNKLEKYLSFHFGKCILEKIITVINFYDATAEVQEEEKEGRIFIDYDPISFKTQELGGNSRGRKINIDKDFGLGIKELYAKLT